ncbi:MAG TPA: 4Fe-4S dicluster domain-containing protein [Planctomycetota bacterium]|nr:4Fe-4S dicluster domain-containing protein [Planctomycetota bacterium]
MSTWFMPGEKLEALLREREGQAVFGPTETKALSWLDAPGEKLSLAPLSKPRSVQSPKGFFLPAAELLGRYGAEAASQTVAAATGLVLFGVRACELRARTYLDHVLSEGDFKDPAYLARREETTLIASDCVDCTETCCCVLASGKPYPESGYDANITPLKEGYLVDVATDKGEAWLGDPKVLGVKEAESRHLAERDETRRKMVARLEEQNRRFTYRAVDETPTPMPEIDDPAWQRFAADCVECGACTHICPTCHCFYLYDQVLGPEKFERVRTWDSCLLSTYPRMAGGVHMKISPRPDLFSRLANRILHKFTYSQQQWGMVGCVGCGRCIDACPGDIDIREAVEELKK